MPRWRRRSCLRPRRTFCAVMAVTEQGVELPRADLRCPAWPRWRGEIDAVPMPRTCRCSRCAARSLLRPAAGAATPSASMGEDRAPAQRGCSGFHRHGAAGQTFLADRNPVRPAGLMVSIAFAEAQASSGPIPTSCASRCGGGVHAPRRAVISARRTARLRGALHEQAIYRFADFQRRPLGEPQCRLPDALAVASRPAGHARRRPDHAGRRPQRGETERAACRWPGAWASEASIRRDLERRARLRKTALPMSAYSPTPSSSTAARCRAALPRIELHSPEDHAQADHRWFATSASTKAPSAPPRKRIGAPREG